LSWTSDLLMAAFLRDEREAEKEMELVSERAGETSFRSRLRLFCREREFCRERPEGATSESSEISCCWPSPGTCLWDWLLLAREMEVRELEVREFDRDRTLSNRGRLPLFFRIARGSPRPGMLFGN